MFAVDVGFPDVICRLEPFRSFGAVLTEVLLNLDRIASPEELRIPLACILNADAEPWPLAVDFEIEALGSAPGGIAARRCVAFRCERVQVSDV